MSLREANCVQAPHEEETAFSGLGPLYVLHDHAGVSSVWCLNGCVLDCESDE